MNESAQAAERIQAYLDTREAWAKHWNEPDQIDIPIVTQPRRGLEGPFWLLLTHADLRAVLEALAASRKQGSALAAAERQSAARLRIIEDTTGHLEHAVHQRDAALRTMREHGDALTALAQFELVMQPYSNGWSTVAYHARELLAAAGPHQPADTPAAHGGD